MNELNTTLTQGVILGQDPQKTIDTIARKMNTSKKNAGRLVMTEQAFFSETAQYDSFGELGVEMYEIVATLDSHTSEICQDMDGKKFKMSDWSVGETAPPFHVYCRSTTVPAFDDEFDKVGERAARGEDGKTYYVPADMAYREWEKAFVGGGGKEGLKPARPGDTIHDMEIQNVTEEYLNNSKPNHGILYLFSKLNRYARLQGLRHVELKPCFPQFTLSSVAAQQVCGSVAEQLRNIYICNRVS